MTGALQTLRAFAVGAALLNAGAAAGQTRPQSPAPTSGQTLYQAQCGVCHAGAGTGAVMLGLRLGKDRAILTERTDLNAAYVRSVVRNGLRSMPALTRVDVSDAQLNEITAYLVRTGRP